MDLRLYYKKIRETTTTIADAYPLVCSRATGDGGKEGILTEVPRAVAAKMLVDGIARIAQPEEAESFYQQQAEAKRVADRAAQAARVQVTVLSSEEMQTLREHTPSKG
jgi:hypothetical protein